MQDLKTWLQSRDYPEDSENLSSDVCCTVNKGGARSMKAGGAWIYDNEIDRVSKEVRDGDIVKVEDFDGYPLGYGIWNGSSKLRVRMLVRRADSVTPALFRKRLEDAWAYRKAVISGESDCCRLVFGEADFLPGITIDLFGDVLVIESLALGTDRFKLLILRDLVRILERDGIEVRGIYERSDAKVRLLEGMERTKGFIGPEFNTDVPVTENGIRYLVDVKDGQKTGFFLDQKYNRAAAALIVRNIAKARSASAGPADKESGRIRVLDCFTHTGSFGLNCAAGAPCEVLSVDASETAILQAQRNAERNGFCRRDGGTFEDVRSSITYLTADVFDLLPELEKSGKTYDMVILDPPAFTKSRKATRNAVKGYREINLRGMKLVKDGGFLSTCSCSHFMDEALFRKTLAEAAAGARKRLRQVEFRTQAPDHPILWGDSESYYLKFGIFQVFREV